MKIGTSEKESSKMTKYIRKAPLIVKGATPIANPKNPKGLILYVPAKPKEILVAGIKLDISGGLTKFNQNQSCMGNMKQSVVIGYTTQLPIINHETIPWIYNKTTVTYNKKDIIKEKNETKGLTKK